MHEINQSVFFRQATQAHLRLLQESEQIRMLESARPYTPSLWDKVALILGNWLISLGSKLRARSIYTKLSEKHV